MIGAIWAGPVTLAGLLVAKLTRCTRAEKQDFHAGAMVYVASPLFFRAFFGPFRVAAFTWGSAIIVAAEYISRAPSVIRHELVHTKQARIFGPLLPLVYFWASVWALLAGGHAYRDNWLEVWARKESGH